MTDSSLNPLNVKPNDQIQQDHAKKDSTLSSTTSPTTCLIVIPARYASKRYPGKPLAFINDKSLIHHTILAGLDAQTEISKHKHLECVGVFVATDDERIQKHVASLPITVDVIMTSSSCENGTVRTAEAYEKLEQKGISADVIINLQGDSLLTPKRFIVALVEQMHKDQNVKISTPALRCDLQTLTNFQDDAAAGRVGGTTMAMAQNGDALYFSKQIIPYIDQNVSFHHETDIPVFHHVGLYAYRPQTLMNYNQLSIGPLETHEKLEQLRFLENGHPIRCVQVEAENEVFWEVNNPEDINRVAPYVTEKF